ncbi:MAG: adenylyl-sulfate kinase [Acidobacteria bacterium]|nr:adenylyl-sulfate kinase [Acidobacteriota bacterium]
MPSQAESQPPRDRPSPSPRPGALSREERSARYGHRGAVLWLTGLPGAGKTTLANALERVLIARGMHAAVLDGDEVRHGLSADLGFSAAERAENIRRVAEVGRLLADAGLIVLAAFVSPHESDRLHARQIVEREPRGIPFSEIYLDASLSVCERRDPKGMYARARAGQIRQFTGVSDSYQPPAHADLSVHTDQCTVDEAVAAVLDHLLPRVS